MELIFPELYQKFLDSTGISTDTRKITEGCIFFALKGANFNGNQFAQEALGKGAKWVVIDEEEHIPSARNEFTLVFDVLTTLQELAKHHRRQFNIPFIAVGGSNGKTTTKELIKNVLSKKYNCFATAGNFNNHIGVPLSLLSITKDTEIAVIEIGANHEGETAELCNILEPNFGLITNIGLDHLEGFGSIEGVERANGELYAYLLQNQGVAFVNSQEQALVRMSARFSELISYPNKGDFYQARLLASDFFVKFETEKGEIVDTQLFGDYNFANIATALCIAKYFGVASSQANQAVAEYIPSNNRSQIIQKGTNHLILDAYNANPSSMTLAVENFAKIKAQKKMLLLGDMYELGEMGEKEHQKLGELVASFNFDTLIFFGLEIQKALKANPKAYYFSDKFSLHNWLQDQKIENTHILIKGSRGVSLESVLAFI